MTLAFSSSFLAKAEESAPWAFLHTGDVHLSNSLPHARAARSGGRTDRLQDQVDALKVMLDQAKDLAAPVILAGDVVDESVLDGATLDALMEVVLYAKVPLAIGPGNHEATSPRGGSFVSRFLSRLTEHVSLSSGLCWIGQRDSETPSRIFDSFLPPWLRFFWVDYCPPDEAQRRINIINSSRVANPTSHADVLWLHHAIKGSRDGGWTCDDGLDGSEICRQWTHVISGHFHDPQAFGVVEGKANGFYQGATMEHDFGDARTGETSERGWWQMDIDRRALSGRWPYEGESGGLYFTHHPSPCPRFHVVQYRPEVMGDIERSSEVIDTIETRTRVNDYVRIEVEVTHSEWAEIEARVRRFADALRTGRSLRLVDVQPKFIRPVMVEARLGKGVETADSRELVDRYARAVCDEEVDVERLIEVGRSLIEEAEHGD